MSEEVKKNAGGSDSLNELVGWQKVGSFKTVGELRHLLHQYDKECSIGFINQPKQDLFLRIEDGRGMLGFQRPSNDPNQTEGATK